MDPFSPMIFLGAFSGFLGAMAIVVAVPVLQVRLIRWWCRSPRSKDHKGFERRMRLILKPKRFVTLLPVLMALLNPTLFLWLLGREFIPMSLSCLTATVVLSALAYPVYIHKLLLDFRQEVATMAVHKIVRISETAFIEEVLMEAAEGNLRELRIPVAHGLGFVVTDRGLVALNRLCADRDATVSIAACLAQGTRAAIKKMQHVQPLNGLPALIQQHRKAEQSVAESTAPSDRLVKALHDIELRIDKLLFSQLTLRAVHPHLYCHQCRTGAELLQYADWRWVQCRNCKQPTELVPHVEKVVGIVGHGIVWFLRDGILRIDLWDEANKRAIQSEVDAIEVVGGADIDYDWALSAVLEHQRNSRADQAVHLPVRLVDSPPMSPNTIAVLRTTAAVTQA